MAEVELWIGIDVGKRTHHACAVDSTGAVVWSRRVDNDQTAIDDLIRSVGTANVRWAVDLTSAVASLLLTLLASTEQHVVYIPGRVVHAMASAYRGEGKTDAKDARLIADIARTRTDFDTVVVPEPLVLNLRHLTGYRAELVADRVRTVNRLRGLLNTIFPALEIELRFLGRSALLLLSTFCTPGAIREVGADGLDAHLAGLGVRSDRRRTVVTAALAATQRQTCVVAGEEVTAALIRRMAGRLLAIDNETKEVDEQIQDLFRQHKYARTLESVPGIGIRLGADFLVETGGTLDGFATAGHLASYAGLVPVPRDSGRITGNLRRPKRYNRGLRRMFYLAAQGSLSTDGPSREYYQHKRDQNKVHTQALLAVARKQVDVVWALIRDDRVFTPAAPGRLRAA
ncbi:IS110 family transposase [Rhodococcus sp. BP-149]|uniref:IS110 family transposase n=1 Tax=unclassified Rhodococcus (in: high G+C Gram-positive bacteria) TaxID=192944 RepID=UPI001C9B4FE3|nr:MULTISPECIES: IS110 family transposase [unclassified Rhodococcus (in: high G+C Gram-positive bacteria)]MBY6687484.1 IS110 family transposase [Rhodococcus sp. BP-288]MBY6696421.1 IS110 family transposase [Rhodococcus sp. BP-188]MBY6700553.1 IS110 family transposase [Rhodococcus sp. BP-285]MBY6704424.1 IS110 family transposase [Rhodococcus sp. BP-283]MBY6713678.1 IS110 family transposase [Rhodococcus sp. BP-160]